MTEELFMQQKRDLMELTVMYTAGTLPEVKTVGTLIPGKISEKITVELGRLYCRSSAGAA